MAEGFLASGKLYRAFEALCVPFETDSNRLHTRPFHHENVSESDRRADGRNLCVTADHGNEMGFRLSRWIRQNLPDESVKPQFDAGGRLLRALYIGEPTESKVCIFHSGSFFSCVRTWVFPLANTSVSSCENRSRSCRILVPSSSSSSQWSVNLTERQWAMCRASPSPNTPLSIPAVHSNPTCPPCSGVSGRPLTSFSLGRSTRPA